MSKSINELTKDIHDNAVAHGWWDDERSFGEIVALCHSELSEALEEDRAGRSNLWYKCKPPVPKGFAFDCINNCKACEYAKPEGIAVEMIDCIIRILDWCGHAGVDVEAVLMEKHEYNKTRPYKHGKNY